jgi:hypothetical protein
MTHYSTEEPRPATSAGVTLSAVEALPDAQIFTRDQVAYLIHLAYLSGGRARNLLDDAELVGTFAEHITPRMAREQRIAKRRAEMDEGQACKPPPPRYWPAVMPGGWPLPPELPSDNPDDWWPEIDGWPCPPPELRGPAA